MFLNYFRCGGFLGLLSGVIGIILVWIFGCGKLKCKLICVSCVVIGWVVLKKFIFNVFVLRLVKFSVFEMVLVRVFCVLGMVLIKFSICLCLLDLEIVFIR